MTKEVRHWPLTNSQELGDYRVFRLRQDRRESPRTGRDHTFFVLDTGDWINVVPVTPDNKIVLIRQFRHGVEEVTLEIPGGMVDESDESPMVSARRELLEETGYAADELIHIGTVTPNPAILNNRCHTFLARNARLVSVPHMDGSEDIQTDLVDAGEIPGLIMSGQINHALVIAAFYFYSQCKH
ncbi:MAG TPA: NUDIX hydrolase [Anaerolineae bacterium]|jgi:8-oxo-dGTP pyrophosphatase MutT (NUDIX family)|nr:NUDIX hydrolase [Anaerolineae bacterium]